MNNENSHDSIPLPAGATTGPPVPPSDAISALEVHPENYLVAPIEAWVARNAAPLLIFVLSLAAAIILTWTFPTPIKKAGALGKPASAAQNEAALLHANADQLGPVQIAWGLVILLGGLILLLGVQAWFFNANARAWLRGMWLRIAIRPLPALRGVDVFALATCELCLILAANAFVRRNPLLTQHSDALLVVGLSIGIATQASIIVLSVWLARRRAGGKEGSYGIWPFWTLNRLTPSRPLWQDIGLGMLCYPASIALVFLAAYLNSQVVQFFGGTPDIHPLLPEIMRPHDPLALAIVLLFVSAGAGFLEEILFRGILYNVLRRYLGRWTGAICAALVFALLHGLLSGFLGIFMLAMILTWLYDKTGRLVAGMTLHAVFNLVTLVVVLTLPQGQTAG